LVFLVWFGVRRWDPANSGLLWVDRSSKSVTLRKHRKSRKAGQEDGKMSTDPTAEFRSPKRALARSFRLSRDRWKAKAGQRRQEIRALKVRLRDLECSRDLWKQKAAHLQGQLDLLREDCQTAPSPPATAQLAESSLTTPTAVESSRVQPPDPTPTVAASPDAPGTNPAVRTPEQQHQPPLPPESERSADPPVKKKIPRSKSRHASS
jgi:hypothetical protein